MMTREKLENLLYRFQVDSFNNEVSQFEYEDIAREILKSFESRTCKNCKYFLNKMSAQWCTKKGNPMIFIYNNKATTFSCSEWEKIENE